MDTPTRSTVPPVGTSDSLASVTRGASPPTHLQLEHQHLHDLIAHYLSTHYPAALPAFLSASGAADPADVAPPNPDLRTLITDAVSAARAEEAARQLAAATLEDKLSLGKMLALPLPQEDELTRVVRTVQLAAANLLAVIVADVPFRRFDTSLAEYVAGRKRCAIVSAADREVRVVEYDSGEVTALLTHKAPVLCLASHPTQPRYLVTGSMDGTTALTDLMTSEVVQKFTAGKFVVRVAFSSDGRWLAAASYDHTVMVYEAQEEARHAVAAAGSDNEDELLDPQDDPTLAAPPTLRYELRHTVKTEQNPEALLFHPRAEWLLYTVRASHELHYLRLPTDSSSPDVATSSETTPPTESADTWSTCTKSFNPHPLDSHVSFTVLDIALHPSGRAIACITGDHAGTAGERVLIYGVEPDETDRLACIWTGAESDAFVLPRVAWLPCGRGVVTSSPTGHLTLLSTSGEVRSRLQVHSAQGSGTSDVVRDMVVVPIHDGEDDRDGWEVVSVGYDRCVRFTRGRP